MIATHVSRPICTIQFHPELYESEFGTQLLRNFFNAIAKVELYTSRDIGINQKEDTLYEELESKYREELKGSKILVALSGGVSSSVLIHFLKELLPEDDIYPLYISTSLYPKDKEIKLIRYFKDRFINFRKIDWEDSIFEALKGVTSAQEKRKIISAKFQKGFSGYFKNNNHKELTHFAIASIQNSRNYQIFTDNENPSLKLITPFSELFKDQVKMLGSRFSLPPFLLSQQPFPSTGFAIRIAGEVTKQKVELLSKIHMFIEQEFQQRRLERYTNQYFPILLNSETLSNRGEQSLSGLTVLLRAVETVDFITAKVSQLPVNELVLISSKLIETFPEISRVLYDLTTKPAGNIEWE